MASDLSDYLVNAIMGWMKSTAFPADPANLYVALYSSDPGNAGVSGTDITSTLASGGRQAVAFGTIAARAMSNSADVAFGNSLAALTVSHFGLWDAQGAGAGNFIGGDALDTPRTVAIGDPVSFLTGDLRVSFA